MAQPPVGFGWFDQPGQQNFPAMGQTPYAPMGQPQPSAPQPYGFPYNPAMGQPGMGWQQPIPQPGYGTYFDPYVCSPQAPQPAQAPPSAGGLGFDSFTGPPMATPSAPCAPVPSINNTVSGDYGQPTQPNTTGHTVVTPVEAGKRAVLITVPSDDKRDRKSPSPNRNTDASVKVVNVTPAPPGNASGDRRQSSRYQEGLKNMADLMTDVDLSDDMLNTVKSRFDLK
ncbi:hypothetical protein AHF37_10442 [Paragonimus kellicotti]|nr:hypothetical protein AHF37_10442 [Paragonimus kellicotti]